MRLKPTLIILLLFLSVGRIIAQPKEKDTSGQSTKGLELYNAYSVSKAIAQFNPKQKLEREEMERLLGGILWYTRNDVDTFTSITETRDYISLHYPILSEKFNALFDTLIGKIDLLKSEKKDLQLAIKDANKLKRISFLIDTIKALGLYIEGNNILLSRVYDTLRTVMPKRLPPWNNRDTSFIRRDSLRIIAERNWYQNTLHDQMTARRNMTNLLNRYERDSLNVDERTALNKIYVQYKLADGLKDQTEKYTIQYNQAQQYEKMDAGDPTGSKPSIALPTQAQLIDAMAIYLVKRVKQESVLWFFETLRRNAKLHELVRTTFPNTYELLQSNEMFETPKMGSLWRYAISKDFINMPETLLNSEWIKTKIPSGSVHFVKSLVSAIRMARMIEQNYSYKDMISVLYTEIPFSDKYEKANLNTLIALLYCLNADFFRQSEKGDQRLQINDLMYMTDQEFEIMLSLVDMKYNHIFYKLILKQDVLYIKNTAQLNSIRKWLGGILMKVQQFDNRRNDMEKLQVLVKGDDKEFQFSNNTTWKFAKDLLEGLLYTDTVANRSFKADHSVLRISIEYMAQIQEFFQMLEKKNFAGSVNALFKIIENLLKPGEIRLSKDQLKTKLYQLRLKYFRDISDSISDPAVQNRFSFKFLQDSSVIIEENSLLGYALKSADQNAINIIRKLAGFLNDVAVTKNSKELAKVIEAYALPPGSYKMKRSTWASVDINAYVGVYSGYEWIKRDTAIKNQELKSAIVYGLTAPIGITISKTLGKKLSKPFDPDELPEEYKYHPERLRFAKNNTWTRRNTTISAFFSIIDLGAVVSYRFTNNDSILPQKMKLEQIFSPGMHLNVGIQGTPLVISAGYEYTPALRKLTPTGDRQLNMHRVQLGILFDIPLFNVAYTADRNRYIKKKKP